jgi:hypothetical protein
LLAINADFRTDLCSTHSAVVLAPSQHRRTFLMDSATTRAAARCSSRLSLDTVATASRQH